ncbi:class V lanthionine synthetase subunit LxmK [Kitasatospora sp. NPDC101157]|uniref:class V lanthionine synthetase subunit LxmK n=1 Tax=Kitasatospora sp. NPDC101157 TaxID=3364098 RepID=UPI0037F96A32
MTPPEPAGGPALLRYRPTDPAAAPALLRYRPTDPAAAPAVQELLDDLGLGRLEPEDLAGYGGRNDNWAGRTTTGALVFLKTVARAPDGSSGELDRALTFETLARRLPPGSSLRVPEHLGSHRPGAVSAYRLLPGARSGAEAALDGDFDEELCRTAGRAVAALHGLDPAGAGLDDGAPPLPPLDWLTAFPWSALQDRSMGQIAAWKLLQDDPEVVTALHGLRARERTAPRTPAHCDLRFDQFVLADEQLYLCDWEEFRLADPARDVGAFVGEWLFHATCAVFAPTGGGAGARPSAGFDFSHQEVLRRGAEGLRRHLPRVEAFWRGYLECRTPDPGLAERAVGYAGWHLFDRLIATAQAHATLSPVARAAAGIGRTLLTRPTGAVTTLRLHTPTGSST